MTLEQYLNKLNELSHLIEGIQSPDAADRLADFLLAILGIAGILFLFFILSCLACIVISIVGHVLGLDKKCKGDDDVYEKNIGAISVLIGFIAMIGLMWVKDVKTPFSANKYNAELNSKFEQTTRTVYNQLIEMDDDEFNQLVKANSSYSLSKEQVREYRAVRQLIRDASRHRKE